jgi:hypothetical protein
VSPGLPVVGSRAGYLSSRLVGFGSGRPLVGGREDFMLGGKTEMIRSYSYLKGRCGAVLASVAVLSIAVPCPVWGQWNGTNPVWTNSNVGIGTPNPTGRQLVINNPGPDIVGLKLTTNNYNWYIDHRGDISSPANSFAIGNDSAVLFTINTSGSVGIGTTNPQYKLAVNGNIGAQDVIVTNTGWSDYVFRPGYRLRPLSEVSQFIQANGHLPDIPTEAEVKEKGVSLGDMQAKLLAKVEELTLHMIQQDKENREVRENLSRENQELRDRLARLEKGAAAGSTPAVAK